MESDAVFETSAFEHTQRHFLLACGAKLYERYKGSKSKECASSSSRTHPLPQPLRNA